MIEPDTALMVEAKPFLICALDAFDDVYVTATPVADGEASDAGAKLTVVPADESAESAMETGLPLAST